MIVKTRSQITVGSVQVRSLTLDYTGCDGDDDQ